MVYLGHTRSRGRRRSEAGLARCPELSSEDVEFETAPLVRVDRTVWLRFGAVEAVGGGVSIGRGWLWALGDLVSPCTVSVAQEQFQASPGLSLIFTGSFSKGL